MFRKHTQSKIYLFHEGALTYHEWQLEPFLNGVKCYGVWFGASRPYSFFCYLQKYTLFWSSFCIPKRTFGKIFGWQKYRLSVFRKTFLINCPSLLHYDGISDQEYGLVFKKLNLKAPIFFLKWPKTRLFFGHEVYLQHIQHELSTYIHLSLRKEHRLILIEIPFVKNLAINSMTSFCRRIFFVRTFYAAPFQPSPSCSHQLPFLSFVLASSWFPLWVPN